MSGGGDGDGGAGDGGAGDGGDKPPETAPGAAAPDGAEPTQFEEMPLEPAPVSASAAPTSIDDLREAVGVARRAKKAAAAEKPAKVEKPENAEARASTDKPVRRDDADRDRRDDDDRDRDRDDDGALVDPEARARRRRMWMTLAISLVVGLVILAFVFLGRANGERLVFQCASEQITAERGRGFPPWGTRTIGGPEWAAIPIPPQAECSSRETESEAELEGWYLDALVEQATAKLAPREANAGGAVDDAEKLLRQALLLARSSERRDQRAEIERLLGDVSYWRGVAKVKAATDALGEAAKLFDEAAARKPRNVTDSSAWGDYARREADELHAGPESLRAPAPLGAGPIVGPHAPPGVALPVEPPPGGDAGVPLAPPDAGVPTGGVLL